jgi:hypothetical protein
MTLFAVAVNPTNAGTVTNLTVNGLDGITADVENPTSAPNISLGLGDITPDSINTEEGTFSRVVVGNDSYDSPFIIDIQSGTDPYRAVFSNFITGTAGGSGQADIAILSGLVPSESVGIMASIYNSTSFTLQGGADAVSAFGYHSSLSFGAQSGSVYTRAGGAYISNYISLSSGSSVSDFYGLLIDEGTVAGTGTVARAWGAYIKQPLYGTSKKATYTDNLTVGNDSLTPPSGGAAISGKVIGGDTAQFTGLGIGVSAVAGQIRNSTVQPNLMGDRLSDNGMLWYQPGKRWSAILGNSSSGTGYNGLGAYVLTDNNSSYILGAFSGYDSGEDTAYVRFLVGAGGASYFPQALATGGLVRSYNDGTFAGCLANGDLSGDVTTSGTLATTLATVNPSPGSFGSSSSTLTATVNAKGLITALSSSAISITASAVSNFGTAVRAEVLTGLSITGGSISASDNILAAFGKLQNQINGVLGGAVYQGVWNASTNSPALTSGVGTKGHYYIVSVAGSTNLDGITDWKVGDWAIFNGITWDKVDNTDAVSSVNGAIGAVSLGGTSGRITVTGTTWDIASTYVGQTSITTLGTVSTGTWQGTVLSPAYGGTGYNNGTHKIYLANGAAGKVLMYDPLANEASYQALGGIVVTDAQGTADQVLVNGVAGVFYQGGVTLSLPQSIAITSDVQFGSIITNKASTPAGSIVAINSITPSLTGSVGISSTLSALTVGLTTSGGGGSGSLLNIMRVLGSDLSTGTSFGSAFALRVTSCSGASTANGAIHADNVAIGSQVTPPANGAYIHGNVLANASLGVGVSPSYKLHVQGSSGTPQAQLGTAANGLQLNVFDSDTTYLVGTSAGAQRLALGTQNNGDLGFMTNNTGRGILTKDGFFAFGRHDGSDARVEIVGGFTSGSASANSQTLKVRAGTLANTTGSDLNLATFQFSTSNQMALGVHGRRMDGSGGGDWTSAAIGLGVDVDASPFSGKANVWFHQAGLALGTGTGALSDSYLQASQVNIWVNEGSNLLTFKVKYSDGTTIKSGAIVLL